MDSIGLYCDDGLGIFESLSGPQMERKKKNIIKVFKMCGLSIIVTTNITSEDYLDVTFNLKTESYQPFRNNNESNSEPEYTDISSNHPQQVLKQLPKLSIEKRLSEIWSSKEIFDNSKHLYEKASQESGFKEKLRYQQKDVNANSIRKKKKRQRKIIWFNPPFSKSVKTNFGKEFFKLLKRHFPKRHKMSKIFNKNTVKLSYSCCRNISSKTSSNNRRIINPPSNNYVCNCRNRSSCPLDNKCLTPSTVYRAIVLTIHKPDKKYFGISETPFKDRYNNYTKDFRHKEYVNSTELSKYILKLKDEGETPSITWNIMSVVNFVPEEVFADYV